MDSSELARALGRIEGKLDAMNGWLRGLDRDVETLKRSRWMLLGGAAVVGAVASLLARFV